MNALRTTYTTVSRLHAYNADLSRERAAALSAAHAKTDHGADGPAALGRERVPVATGKVRAMRVVCECHIDTLHAQGHLSSLQWSAGTWFRRRYLLGYRGAIVVAGYGECTGGGGLSDEAVRVTDARHDLAQIAQVLTMLQWAAVETAAGHDLALGRGRMRFLADGLDLVALYRDTIRKR